MIQNLLTGLKIELFQDITGKLTDANVRVTLFLLAATAFIFSLIYYFLSLQYLCLSHLVTGILYLALEQFFTQKLFSRKNIVRFGLAIAYLHTFNVTITTGGTNLSPTILWFTLIPIGAAFFSDILTFWFFITLVALTFPLLKILEHSAVSHFIPLSPDYYYIIRSSSFIGVTFITTFWVYNFGRIVYKNFENLKESKEHMAELVRLLTHDIAGPISIIRAYTKFLQNSEYNAEGLQKALQSIDKNSKNIESLIIKVREIKALESGKRIIKTMPSNLHECVTRSLELVKEKFDEKDIELHLHTEGGDFDAVVEPDILTLQILPNLLTNALKFSFPQSRVRLALRSHKDRVQIEIADAGIGIPPPLLENIFSYDKVTTRIGTSGERGTGFGMPLVKSFVEKMNGTIHIESATKESHEGMGGTKVILCFKKADAEPSPQ